MLKHLCKTHFKDKKRAPAELQGDLLKFKATRDQLAHDLWEILNSDIVAVNPGAPEFVITHEQLNIELNSLIDFTCSMNMTF